MWVRLSLTEVISMIGVTSLDDYSKRRLYCCSSCCDLRRDYYVKPPDNDYGESYGKIKQQEKVTMLKP